jgi:hypothetical protein
MALQDVAPVLDKEFVTLKLDFDRSKGARDIEKRFVEKEQGLPWFVFIDPEGQAIVTSVGPRGNVGMPWQPHEVVHFQAMLEKAKKHLTDEQIAALVKSIQEFRKKSDSGG